MSEQPLPLADYYGCTYGRTTPDKMKRLPTVEWGQVLDVPTIAESPVSFELEVKKGSLYRKIAEGGSGISSRRRYLFFH